MQVIQKRLTLAARSRGFHLITREIVSQVPDLSRVSAGLMHVFILHTSASLTINENASPEVPGDLERHFNRMVPEDAPYAHTQEGPDDMPAHIKASLLGSSVTIPVSGGRPVLGTWQGIYLCEHRDHGGAREVVVTVMGEAA